MLVTLQRKRAASACVHARRYEARLDELFCRGGRALRAVKSGMTGPWQVEGRNKVTDFEQVVALEPHYVRTRSLVSDLAIAFQTIPAVVRREGRNRGA